MVNRRGQEGVAGGRERRGGRECVREDEGKGMGWEWGWREDEQGLFAAWIQEAKTEKPG